MWLLNLIGFVWRIVAWLLLWGGFSLVLALLFGWATNGRATQTSTVQFSIVAVGFVGSLYRYSIATWLLHWGGFILANTVVAFIICALIVQTAAYLSGRFTIVVNLELTSLRRMMVLVRLLDGNTSTQQTLTYRGW
jgi:hypothetical protein